MKKLILSIVFSVLYISSASAELGVNVGVSGNIGLFAGSANEKFTGGETNNGSEHGEAAWGSVFIEKTLGDVMVVGVDYVPAALETETQETSKFHKAGATDTSAQATNKIQIDFEDLSTFYVAARMGDFYVKGGIVNVEVITNENLGTGGAYGNTDLDGTMIGAGYNHTMDNGMFVRVEGNFMSFDGASLTNANDSEKVIKLKSLDGVTGKVSIGTSF